MKSSGWLIVLVLVGVVILGVVSFQQGGLMQARVFSPKTTATEGSNNVVAAPIETGVPIDPYTKLEAYCEQVKAAAISDCGEETPDKDYTCRTTQADQTFTDCVKNTDPSKIPDTAYLSPSN